MSEHCDICRLVAAKQAAGYKCTVEWWKPSPKERALTDFEKLTKIDYELQQANSLDEAFGGKNE